jgi:invasion protein IalB
MNNMNERLVVGGVALLVGLLLGWAVHGLTSYSPATETVTSFDGWRTACPAATAATKDQSCAIVQDIMDSKTKTEIARILIARDNGKQVLGITLPLGVSLEPGVGLSFGTSPVQLIGYRTCNQGGCTAEAPFDDKMQAAFNGGKDGRILFAGLDNKPIPVPLTLKGFDAAQKAYRRNEAKRGSWFWRMW